MTRAPQWTTARTLLFSISILATATAVNCSDQKETRPVNTQPVQQPATAADSAEQPNPATQPAERPTTPEQPTTRPAATQPTKPQQTKPEQGKPQPAETRPEAAKPESTYSSKPPYPVSLFVKSPSQEQPGWLKIEQLIDNKDLGTARGKFPEQNRIYVETGNVRRIRIHVTHLPLRPNERVILQIDKQGMVISRTRPYTTLELSPTGEWVVVKEKEKD